MVRDAISKVGCDGSADKRNGVYRNRHVLCLNSGSIAEAVDERWVEVG